MGGIKTDMLFINALMASDEVTAMVGDRIFDTAIPGKDEDVDNEPVPYIIVSHNGLNNEDWTKDNDGEGETDVVQIGMTVAANDREELADLCILIRQAVNDYLDNYEPQEGEEDFTDDLPENREFSMQKVQYDPWKPCFFVDLNWTCDINNLELS